MSALERFDVERCPRFYWQYRCQHEAGHAGPHKTIGDDGSVYEWPTDTGPRPDPPSDAAPPEERIVAGIFERRDEPGRAMMITPYVAPGTLLGIARRAGVPVERIGGASVEIYTVLGWLRIYETKGLGPGEEILFSFPPRYMGDAADLGPRHAEEGDIVSATWAGGYTERFERRGGRWVKVAEHRTGELERRTR